ncbi:MAG: HAD-IA family hydrolase [Bacteroidales bacterium]|nr:HAD-IA family hydrolase [Bacteroidales bacterium]
MDFRQEIDVYLKKTGFCSFSPKAFLFDMDGVLYDSMPFHAKAWTEAFSHVGVHFDEYSVYKNEGRTGKTTVNEAFTAQLHREATDDEIQRIYADKAAIFMSISKTNPMPFAKEVLTALQAAGKKIVLVTGSGQKSLISKLNETYPTVFSPENMVTSFDVKYGKPNPEPYLMALQKAGVQPNEAIVIENAPLGVQAGVGAGIFTIALNTGILRDEDLANEGANVVLPSMKDLYNLLPTILEM